MKKLLSALGILFFALLLCFGSVPCGYAQESADEDVFTLEEITVTAEKREENLQNVPLAIEAVSGVDLREMGKVDFYDALSGITSLVMQEGTRGFIVSLRGMSNDQGGQDSPVAVHIDGDYTRREEAGIAGLLDMSRIEVLNGPQGTLYGRLSTAGVVNLISNNPVDDYEASGLIEYGSFELLRTEGVMNVPISDSWSMRAAYQTVVRDGYLSSGENDADTKVGRLKTRFKPNDDIDLVLTFEDTKTGGRGTGSVRPFIDQPSDPWVSYYEGTDTYRKTDTKRYVADLNWDLGFGNLTVHPSYRELELHLGWILMDNFQARYENTEETAAEVRLASPDESDIEWLVGLYYYDREQLDEDDVNPPGDANYWFSTGESESKAVFGRVTYPVTDKFKINGGIRHTEDEESEYGLRWGRVMASEDSFSNTDYKVGIEYDISDRSMLWADFSTGFRAGKRRNKPEYLDAYQLGVKNRFFDDVLQMNVSAFYYDYEGYQAEKIFTFPDGTFDMGAGSGDATIFGVDVQSNYIITPKDRFDLSVSYLNSEYKNIVVTYMFAEPEYFDGGTMTHSPEWTIAASYEHTFELPNGSALRARADTRYETESSISFAVDPLFNIPWEANLMEAHTISNASLTYSSPDGKWSISTYVKNIEDYAKKNHMLGNTMRIGPPRTYACSLSVRF